MRLHTLGQTQPFRQFHGNDLLRVMAQDDMNVVLARVQIIEQPLRVKRAGGPGDGNQDFQQVKRMAA